MTSQLIMTSEQVNPAVDFNIVEASIEDHRNALGSGRVTSVELAIAYFQRILSYDIRGGLNAFTVLNPTFLEDAAASDARRTSGLPPRPLEGIPYTLKDSFRYKGLTVTNGSPALDGLQSTSDSFIASKLRAAGAVLMGKTNMPPMAAGGMQRGLYGRAESPYNSKYLTAAFSSGSSNGAATSTTSSMAVFAMGSETVSSGRSPASNNALIAYTPSRGILSCRGLWPLYVTCDVPVPYTRTMKDMLEVLSVIAEPDQATKGDFWREQKHVTIPKAPQVDYRTLTRLDSLKGKRIGVPKLYIGQPDSDPHAKPITVHPSTVNLWDRARAVLETLGAEVIETDFPVVTNYENDSISGEANNVVGAPANWNQVERSLLNAKAWDEFLVLNNDPKIPSLTAVDPMMLFPKPEKYLPDTFIEERNWVQYSRLPDLAAQHKNTSIYDLEGLKQGLVSLEAQRKRDFEDWMDELQLDLVAFPANGDVGLADLEFDLESTAHSLQNGVKYSNGNRAIRHLGIPTVSVPMGILEGREMPINLTFAARACQDGKLLAWAYAYEQASKERVTPPLTPGLDTDVITSQSAGAQDASAKKDEVNFTFTLQSTRSNEKLELKADFDVKNADDANLVCYVDGQIAWSSRINRGSLSKLWTHTVDRPVRLGWDLRPLKPWPVVVLVVVKSVTGRTSAKWQFVDLDRV